MVPPPPIGVLKAMWIGTLILMAMLLVMSIESTRMSAPGPIAPTAWLTAAGVLDVPAVAVLMVHPVLKLKIPVPEAYALCLGPQEFPRSFPGFPMAMLVRELLLVIIMTGRPIGVPWLNVGSIRTSIGVRLGARSCVTSAGLYLVVSSVAVVILVTVIPCSVIATKINSIMPFAYSYVYAGEDKELIC